MAHHKKALWMFVFIAGCAGFQKRLLEWRLASVREDKAKAVVLTPPPLPYKEERLQAADRFWRSSDAGSISYFSSCSRHVLERGLEDMERSALSALASYRILETKTGPGFRQTYFQDISASKTWNMIYLFKTKKCFFILNFVSPSLSVFEKNLSVFQRFVQNFMPSRFLSKNKGFQ